MVPLSKQPSPEKIEKVMLQAISVFNKSGINYEICGGLAVQNYGYLRYTHDVDFVVSDIKKAKKELSNNGFTFTEYPDSLVQEPLGIIVDLLPGGSKMQWDSYVKFPVPTASSKTPTYVPLPQLISLKLDAGRFQDIADCGKLVEINKLPRDFPVDANLKRNYEDMWDSLQVDETGKYAESRESRLQTFADLTNKNRLSV